MRQDPSDEHRCTHVYSLPLCTTISLWTLDSRVVSGRSRSCVWDRLRVVVGGIFGPFGRVLVHEEPTGPMDIDDKRPGSRVEI